MLPSRISGFVLRSLAWLLALMVPWYYLSPYLGAPVISLAGESMQFMFRWAEGVERHGAIGTLVTRLNVLVSQGSQVGMAQLTPEVDYRSFGYGVVLLWALLLASASSARQLPAKMVIGTAVLIPLQSASLCFYWLRDVALGSGPDVLQQTGLRPWATEVIAYGYQFGFLMLTPLAPVLLWLFLERHFVHALWVEMTLAGVMERAEMKDAGSS